MLMACLSNLLMTFGVAHFAYLYKIVILSWFAVGLNYYLFFRKVAKPVASISGVSIMF